MRTHLRRLAAICATTAVATTVLFIGAAGAAIGDGILGGTPTATERSTVCPAGSAVTAVGGNVDLYGEVVAVTADCSGGVTAVGGIGDLAGGATLYGSTCGAGEIAVGIVGQETDNGITQLSLQCRASDLSGTISRAVSTLGSDAGVADGPYDCPDGQALTGLTGSVGTYSDGDEYAREVEIQCGSPAVSLPTIAFSGSAPDGTVGLPYSFTYSASGDSGIAISVLGSLPPGLAFDPTTEMLTGTPTAAGDYTFVVRATGASSASADLDEAITISPAPVPPPTLGSSPSSVAFGDQLVGSSSAQHTVTITNTAPSGSQTLVLGSLSIPDDPIDFRIVGDTCSGASLAPAASCTVGVVFTPTARDARTATLRVPSNAASSPDSIALSGNGTAAPSADVRVSISGPNSALSGSQNAYVMTVANLGPSTALGVSLTLQVPNGTKFVGVSTTHGTCTHPSSGATSGTIHCELGDLAAGASAIDSVTLKITLNGKGGSLAVVAQAASASTPDPDLSNNVASLTTTVNKK